MKGKKRNINILISLFIAIGFIIIGIITHFDYVNLFSQSSRLLSEEIAANVYAEIRIALSEPLNQAMDISNDYFVEEWIYENDNTTTTEQEDEIFKYLDIIKSTNNYNSVFIISSLSNTIYYVDSNDELISENNFENSIYTDFLESEEPYQLTVDVNDLSNNALSLFTYCRIEDESGNILGVAGVGLAMDTILDTLESFETTQDVTALLFNTDGTITLNRGALDPVSDDSDTLEADEIENPEADDYTDDSETLPDSDIIADDDSPENNIFTYDVISENKEQILYNTDDFTSFYYEDPESNTTGYYVTKYIDNLDWYLLIRTDTTKYTTYLNNFLTRNILLIIAIVLVVLLLVYFTNKQHQKALISMGEIDSLTGLHNRRGFETQMITIMNNVTDVPTFLFVVDIDNFKHINDHYGHLIGDEVLVEISKIFNKHLSLQGIVSRWGGDEFVGVIKGDENTAKDIVKILFDEVHENPMLQKHNITISMGATKISANDDIDSAIYHADIGLYKVKGSGKNSYIFNNSESEE
jgi:diguanylate cyclase (GGDEF)-like protein